MLTQHLVAPCSLNNAARPRQTGGRRDRGGGRLALKHVTLDAELAGWRMQ